MSYDGDYEAIVASGEAMVEEIYNLGRHRQYAADGQFVRPLEPGVRRPVAVVLAQS